MMKKIAYWGVS